MLVQQCQTGHPRMWMKIPQCASKGFSAVVVVVVVVVRATAVAVLSAAFQSALARFESVQ